MFAPEIQKEHAIETYKSLIQISVEGMKILAVLNGGAAVALLAYMGNIASKCVLIPDMRYSMFSFVFGLVLCGGCFITSYGTQYILYNESLGRFGVNYYKKHKFWCKVTMWLSVFSIFAFAIGSGFAVVTFQK